MSNFLAIDQGTTNVPESLWENSSNGRTTVSKTAGQGFESLFSCLWIFFEYPAHEFMRVKGIEPLSSAWKADNLPLIYTRANYLYT